MPKKNTNQAPVPKEEEVTTAPAEETTVAAPVPKEEASDDITVADPEILRPKELPLVVTPGSKGWANEAQAEYARTLNAYAYTNPEKFKAKKDKLIKNLRALAENPGLLSVYQGGGSEAQKLSYKNHITQPNQE